ncbi:DedA family protein [Candidatus Electronema sp. JM]|uniref:DedA family protein n=1 Tax=Candidatus Electronema sp. JM TaxID=3401571 RepID=UPI003AA95219
MFLEQLIATYGYAAIAIGTFFEGETILVLGGFAAYRGYLELPWVITWAFIGTLLGDQLYYYIGRIKGKSFIKKRPKWKKKSEKLFVLLDKHQIWLILIFRFLYGLRSISPFLIGASKVDPKRFLIYNIIGALIWAISVGILGYVFGPAFEKILIEIKRYEIAALAVLGAVALFFYFRRKSPPDNLM